LTLWDRQNVTGTVFSIWWYQVRLKKLQDEELNSLRQAERDRYSIQYMLAPGTSSRFQDEELDSLGQTERARYSIQSMVAPGTSSRSSKTRNLTLWDRQNVPGTVFSTVFGGTRNLVNEFQESKIL
jgi:hypothetical protein